MLLPNKYLLLIVYFLFQINLFTQTINSLRVEGNTSFDESQILSWSEVRMNMPVYPGLKDSIKSKLALQFADRGYFNNIITVSDSLSEDSSAMSIAISIEENPPSKIKYVNVLFADSSLRDVVDFKAFDFLEGEIFNKFVIEESINELITGYENAGFPFTKIIVESVILFSDSTDEQDYAGINLKVVPGKQSTIDKIEITGNESTKDYVILRELRIQKGEEYIQEKIEELPERLNKLRFFEPVTVPEFYFNSEEEGVLVIKVKERQTNNFDGIIGYVPGTREGEKGYLTGLVNVSLRNLFGTGRAAAFRWQQFDRFSQELELKYLEPWLIGFPFNINGALFQRKQDTTYVQRRIEGAVEYLATEDISASVFVSSESVIPSETDSTVFTVYNSSILTSGVALKLDTRDDPFAPTSGLLFVNSYSLSNKTINGPEQFITPDIQTKITLQRLTIQFSIYYELFIRNIVALSLNGAELRGSFFEDSDLFRLGGTQSLRGYREDQFLGSRIFWSNLEYRLLLTRRSYAFIFLDTGYYLRSEDSFRSVERQEDFLTGFGFGLSLETGLGILGVSYALGEGDSFSEGKIHFGVINEF